MKYRTGRHNGRAIYRQVGAEPDRAVDACVGLLDTPELAALAVDGMNQLAAEPPEQPLPDSG